MLISHIKKVPQLLLLSRHLLLQKPEIHLKVTSAALTWSVPGPVLGLSIPSTVKEKWDEETVLLTAFTHDLGTCRWLCVRGLDRHYLLAKFSSHRPFLEEFALLSGAESSWLDQAAERRVVVCAVLVTAPLFPFSCKPHKFRTLFLGESIGNHHLFGHACKSQFRSICRWRPFFSSLFFLA